MKMKKSKTPPVHTHEHYLPEEENLEKDAI
jgi:hypothetical protein